MVFLNVPKTQQSDGVELCPVSLVRAGGWALAPHHAISLRSAEAGVIRVVHGRLWATVDGPHSGPANDWGDRVLQQGEALEVRADQRLVIESWARCSNDPVYFSWEPLVQALQG